MITAGHDLVSSGLQVSWGQSSSSCLSLQASTEAGFHVASPCLLQEGRRWRSEYLPSLPTVLQNMSDSDLLLERRQSQRMDVNYKWPLRISMALQVRRFPTGVPPGPHQLE